jgi:hypothetical protein
VGGDAVEEYHKLMHVRGSTSSRHHCATHHKVAGLGLDEENEFFLIYLILPAARGPGVHSASNRNECQKQKKNNVSEKLSAEGA